METLLLRKMCFPYLTQLPCVRASVCVCECQGEILGSICTASPVLLWPSVFSFLSCVTQQDVLCCAIRIAQHWGVRGNQQQEGFAWFWEMAGAYVCLVKKGVWFWRGGRTYLGLLQLCLLFRINLFPVVIYFL